MGIKLNKQINNDANNNILNELLDVRYVHMYYSLLFSSSKTQPKRLYEDIKLIAPIENGMIRMVRNKLTNKIRAMKIVKRDPLDIVFNESTFMKELAIIRMLDHPNILKVFEFFEEEKYFFLVSEYCEEGELFKIIRNNGKGLSEYSVAHIMRQLLSMVSYCHSNNIMNRDLRLENILVESITTKILGNQQILLYDIRIPFFRNARSFKNSKKVNKKVGNPYYIAPEVLMRKYDEKCDIWSCGIIMYILLTGKAPFTGSNEVQILDNVLGCNFDNFNEDLVNNSISCKNFLKLLLKYDPEKRPSAKQAIQHKWINEYSLDLEIDKMNLYECYNNILKYNMNKRFEQVVLSFMVHNLTDMNDLSEIRKMFLSLDEDNDGVLTYDEIFKGFKMYLPIDDKEKEFYRSMKRIDHNNYGFIQYLEFIKVATNKRNFITKHRLDIVFNLIDHDADGIISLEDLKSSLILYSKYSENVLDEILNELDLNNCNQIGIEEFKNIMVMSEYS